jgi:hypothetical protein
MRDPLLVGRRWFGCVSSFMRANGCHLLALVSSGWRRGLVGLLSGSCRGLVSLFRRGTWGCRGRRRSRSCARFARWGVLLGVVGRGSVLMLYAHAHTHRPPLLVFPVGAVRRRSCRGVA